MKSKIAEDLRLAGNAKFYHSISYSSVEDIKADIVGLIKEHGTKYTEAEYISLFDQADYWLEPSLVNSQDETFKAIMDEIMAFDMISFITSEYAKVSDEAEQCCTTSSCLCSPMPCLGCPNYWSVYWLGRSELAVRITLNPAVLPVSFDVVQLCKQ